jgi:predicted amidohydrolase
MNDQPPSVLRVAAVQMASSPQTGSNLETAGRLIAEAADAGAQLVGLPEYFSIFGERETDKVACREAEGQGPVQTFLSETAARHRIWLVGGSVPLATPKPARVANACLVFGPDGRRRARYDKIHLFGFTRGAERFDESATILPGRTPVVFDCEAPPGSASRWRVGLSICYDLRFPELYRALSPVDLLVIPSSFTARTGAAHWEVLLRARAIENQCWVLAPAQGGVHAGGRRTWGHSIVVDPWGEIVAERSEPGEGIVLATLDRGRINEVRAGLPALAHRVM